MSIEQLKKWANSKTLNIADDFSEDELNKIGNRVLNGFNEDLKSMEEWLNDVKKVEELVCLVSAKKTTPLPNSSNVKYPLITKAVYEFSSRTYPEIIRDGKVVKGRVVGKDDEQNTKAQKAERTSTYINYQLMEANAEWELELDRLLNLIAMMGFICKKTYFEPVRKVIKSEICDYKDLIINSDVKSLEDARRISHVIRYRLNDLIENANSGVFLKDAVDELILQHENDELDPVIEVIEQHTYIDLDDDSYQEPYIVTALKENGKVLRIAPRYTENMIKSEKGKILYIDAMQFFTDFHFLVSPKGKFQSVGFGILMFQINETINSLFNQLSDAGQLANMQGGYMDARLKPIGSGDQKFDPGQWQKVKSLTPMNLKDGILPITYKEPSAVLFQLLELLINAAKELSSSTEVMTGAASPENAKTGATNALLQEGIKIFNSIQRRIYRSLTSEYKKLFILNSVYLDEITYFNVLDDSKAVLKEDFDVSHVDILPVADPNLSTDVQRSLKNQTLLAIQQLPGVNPLKVTQRILMNSMIDKPEDLMKTPQEMQVPNPDLIKVQADIGAQIKELEQKDRELALKEKQQQLDAIKQQVDIVNIQSQAIKNLADAEAAEAGSQFQEYQAQLKLLSDQLGMINDVTQMHHEKRMQDQEHLVRLEEMQSAERTAKSVAKSPRNTSTS